MMAVRDAIGREVQRFLGAAVAGKLSKSYVYYLLSGERDNLSQDKVEALAAFFDVSPLFFSRDPRNWLPPVPSHTIQYALRCTGDLDERSQHLLDELLARAYELSTPEEERKKKGAQ